MGIGSYIHTETQEPETTGGYALDNHESRSLPPKLRVDGDFPRLHL